MRYLKKSNKKFVKKCRRCKKKQLKIKGWRSKKPKNKNKLLDRRRKMNDLIF